MENIRKATNHIIALAMSEQLSWFDVAFMCLKYMSEEDVAKMLRANGIDLEDVEE